MWHASWNKKSYTKVVRNQVLVNRSLLQSGCQELTKKKWTRSQAVKLSTIHTSFIRAGYEHATNSRQHGWMRLLAWRA
jgi:hypothetical protein